MRRREGKGLNSGGMDQERSSSDTDLGFSFVFFRKEEKIFGIWKLNNGFHHLVKMIKE